jgi:hypothetical protein
MLNIGDKLNMGIRKAEHVILKMHAPFIGK